jgi:hypothetical protein
MCVHILPGRFREVPVNRFGSAVSFRPGRKVKPSGLIVDMILIHSQNSIPARIGTQSGGRNLRQAVLCPYMLGMQMSAQAERNPVFPKQIPEAFASVYDVAPVKNAVLKQILMSGDKNKAIFLPGLTQLVLDPSERLIGDTAKIVDGILVKHHDTSPIVYYPNIA